MSKNNEHRKQAEDLRKRAEIKAALDVAERPHTSSPDEMLKLIHELQVHQIELEMQNEELRRTQVELDASRACYFDLFDLAPVGYLTVNDPQQAVRAY
jgi:hypothetical protein